MTSTDNTRLSNSTKALVRGTGTNLFGVIFRIVFVFLHSLIAARIFGAELYGIYAIGVANVALLSLASELGFGRALTHFVARYLAKNQAYHIQNLLKLVVGLSLPASLVLGALLYFQASALANLFGESSLEASLRILGFAIPAMTLATLLGGFTQGFQVMRHRTLAWDILQPGAELSIMLIFGWIGFRHLGLPLAYVVSMWLSALLLIYFSKNILRRVKVSSQDVNHVKLTTVARPLLSFATPVLVVNLLMQLSNRITLLMVGAIGSSAMAGVFSVANRLVASGMTVLLAINMMFAPIISGLIEQNEFKELARLYKSTTRWSLMLSLPFFISLAFLGEVIVGVFGPEFSEGIPALIYLIVAAIFNLSTGSCGMILMMSGKPHYNALNEAILMVSVIVLNLILIPQYGLLGAVWAVAIGTLMVNTLRVVEVWFLLRIQPYSFSLAKVLAASIVMLLFLWVWTLNSSEPANLYLSVLGPALASVAYVLTLVALGLESDEQEVLRLVGQRILTTLSPSG